MPKVSVIMPSLNVRDYIVECIESVLNQTLSDIEIIMVDAYSEDGTLEIIQSYANMDSRIKILLSEKRSYGYQMNLGIQSANGEFISIVETDDYIVEDMMEILYTVATSNNLDCVKADYYDFCDRIKGERIEVYRRGMKSNLSGKHNVEIYENDDIPMRLMESPYIWNGLYKRDFIQDENIVFNESDGASFQDMGFALQVFLKAKRMGYIAYPVYYYRNGRPDSSSMSSKKVRKYFQEVSWIRLKKLHPEGLDVLRRAVLNIYNMKTFLFSFSMKMLVENELRDESELKRIYELYHDLLGELGSLRESFMKVKRGIDYDKFEKVYTSFEYALECIREDSESCARKETNYHLTDNWIIFGCGILGRRLLWELSLRNINVIGYVDNDKTKWNSIVYNTQVLSLDECIEKYKHGYYFVASKLCALDIKKQLMELGVKEEKIVIYERD